MARYIDADSILKEIYYRASRTSLGETTVPYLHWKSIVSLIKDAPTADVAPRAEVAREILQEVRQAALSLVLANAMGENFDLEKRFAEIEKKYTDATDTNVGHKRKENKKDAVTDIPIQLSIFDKEDKND